MAAPNSNTRCSFCYKRHNEVGPLIEGPKSVYICAPCIELCRSIIEQEQRRRNPSPNLSPIERLRHTFTAFFQCVSPTIHALLGAVEHHYTAMAAGKSDRCSPLLLLGPSRASRLFVSRAISHALEVPLVIGNQQSLVQTLKEFNSDSLLYQLFENSEFNLSLANRGVIYVEGLSDKSAQRAFVDLIDGAAATAFPTKLDLRLDRIQFLCGADADGLDQIITSGGRHLEQPIVATDLLAYGFIPEFVNRSHLALWLDQLGDDTLVRIISTLDLKANTAAL